MPSSARSRVIRGAPTRLPSMIAEALSLDKRTVETLLRDRSATLTITGKGGKQRIVPLLPAVTATGAASSHAPAAMVAPATSGPSTMTTPTTSSAGSAPMATAASAPK